MNLGNVTAGHRQPRSAPARLCGPGLGSHPREAFPVQRERPHPVRPPDLAEDHLLGVGEAQSCYGIPKCQAGLWPLAAFGQPSFGF